MLGECICSQEQTFGLTCLCLAALRPAYQRVSVFYHINGTSYLSSIFRHLRKVENMRTTRRRWDQRQPAIRAMDVVINAFNLQVYLQRQSLSSHLYLWYLQSQQNNQASCTITGMLKEQVQLRREIKETMQGIHANASSVEVPEEIKFSRSVPMINRCASAKQTSWL